MTSVGNEETKNQLTNEKGGKSVVDGGFSARQGRTGGGTQEGEVPKWWGALRQNEGGGEKKVKEGV